MRGKDLLSIADLSAEEIWLLIKKAGVMKQGERKAYLKGQVLALLFEKPSLRTRVSFEVAMQQLGGHALYLSPAEVGLGKREQVADVGKTLSRYVDGIVVRTFSHSSLDLLAQVATVPVINGLSDLEHPCQALGDLLTIYEKKGVLQGLTLAFIGDGNNVARSLLLAAALVGVNFHIASPPAYQLPDKVWSQGQKFAQHSGARLQYNPQPWEIVKGADIVYTDVWVSMGQEAETAPRHAAFAGYQVTPELLAQAGENALFMHPLPAHHGEEVALGLLDHPQSVVFHQAENRLHIQKAILAEMLVGWKKRQP